MEGFGSDSYVWDREMRKDNPISAVKPRATRKRTATKRTPTGARTRSSRTAKGKRRRKGRGKRTLPMWVLRTLIWMSAAAILIAFYFLFIRPYSYRWKPCYGMKAYGVCLPYGFEVHGFDVSHHQGDIDWGLLQQVQQAPFPVRFVFMKASEGRDFGDHRFIDNFRAARTHGFIRGAYHFYNPKTDASQQADFFIRSVRLEPGDLPPVLDVERRGDNLKQFKEDVALWLSRIEHHYKVKPILYTSYKFKEAYLNDSIFNTYPYWIAHYYVDSVSYTGPWKFWQHTDRGVLPGIKECVDLNVFNGTLDELKALTIRRTDSSR